MLWNGNERGKKYVNENLKATVFSTIMTYQKQQENVECFNYLGSMTANDAT
jgi:hypothetical protein